MRISIFLIAVSLILAHSRAFAGEPPFNKEVCQYEGNTDYNGHVTIETRYKRSGDTIRFRTLLRYTASYLHLVNLSYLIDEIDEMNSQDEKPRRVSLNTRYSIFGNIKKQIWDRFNFDWNAHQTHGFRIQGKEESEISSKYPGFESHWPIEAFGDGWFEQYEASHPDVRSDMDVKEIGDTIASPLYMALFKTRFADPALGPASFQAFIPAENKGKPLPVIHAEPSMDQGEVLWKIPILLGSLSSPEDRPMEIRVDPATKTLKSIHLVIEHSLGTAEGDLQFVGCQH